MNSGFTVWVLAGLSLFPVLSVKAQSVDPAGDFIPTYTGPRNGDLDVLQANVQYDGQNFRFGTTLNGPIGLTPTGLYVWGFDRGAGTARFGAVASGVTFDSVVVFTAGGAGRIVDLTNGQQTVLDPANIHISGSTLTAEFPTSLLPSQGFSTDAFTWNLWPRSGSGGIEVISDFAPDNSNLRVQAVPEPGTLALLLGGGAALARFAARRKRA